MKLRTRIDFPAGFEDSEKATAVAHRIAGKHAMELFIKERLDHRFTGRNNEISEKDRTTRYKTRKSFRGKASSDRNFSGKSRQEAKRTAEPRATAKGMGVRVTLDGYKFGRTRSSKRPDLNKEMRQWSDDEVAFVMAIYQKRFVEVLTNPPSVPRGRRRA